MYRKFRKVWTLVFEIREETDRQTDRTTLYRHTDTLIAILNRIPTGRKYSLTVVNMLVVTVTPVCTLLIEFLCDLKGWEAAVVVCSVQQLSCSCKYQQL